MALNSAAADTHGSVHLTFASRYVQESLPRFRMPDRSIPKDVAYQIISDELMLDGNPRLNLASFVTTWMERQCDKLLMQAINKNYVDMDEFGDKGVEELLPLLQNLIDGVTFVKPWHIVERWKFQFIDIFDSRGPLLLREEMAAAERPRGSNLQPQAITAKQKSQHIFPL